MKVWSQQLLQFLITNHFLSVIFEVKWLKIIFSLAFNVVEIYMKKSFDLFIQVKLYETIQPYQRQKEYFPSYWIYWQEGNCENSHDFLFFYTQLSFVFPVKWKFQIQKTFKETAKRKDFLFSKTHKSTFMKKKKKKKKKKWRWNLFLIEFYETLNSLFGLWILFFRFFSSWQSKYCTLLFILFMFYKETRSKNKSK
jgi:hypothetical protein